MRRFLARALAIIAACSLAANGMAASGLFLQPYNRTFIMPGDSRSEAPLAGSFNGYSSYGSGTGVQKLVNASTWDAWLGMMTDYRLIPGNSIGLGIGGQNTQEIFAYPRPIKGETRPTGYVAGTVMTVTTNATGIPAIAIGQRLLDNTTGAAVAVITGSASNGATCGGSACTGTTSTGTYLLDTSLSIGSSGATVPLVMGTVFGSNTIADVAANEAANVLMYVGTNGRGAGLLPGAVQRQALLTAIQGLTNPTFIYPNYGGPLPLFQGRPKNIILINETPDGVMINGTQLNAFADGPSAESFRQYARWVLALDAHSGAPESNPRVVVVPAFDDPRLLDITGASVCGAANILWCPMPGLKADGLHPATPEALTIAQIAAARIVKDYDKSTDFGATMPTTDNVTAGSCSNWLNADPLFLQIGTDNVSSHLVSGRLYGDIFPTNTTVSTGGAITSGQTLTLSNVAARTALKVYFYDWTLGKGFYADTTSGSAVITIRSTIAFTAASGDGVNGQQMPASSSVTVPASMYATITYAPLGGNLGNEMVVHLTSPSATTVEGDAFILRQTVSSACLATYNASAGDYVRFVSMAKFESVSGTLRGIVMQNFSQGTSSSNINNMSVKEFVEPGSLIYGAANSFQYWENVPAVTSYPSGQPLRSLTRGPYAQLNVWRKYLVGGLDYSKVTSPPVHPYLAYVQLTAPFKLGSTVDYTIHLSQWGAFKVVGDPTLN